jgi:hypothetical protein
MNTQTIYRIDEHLQFITSPKPERLAQLPDIPLIVAVARVIGRPVDFAKQLPVPVVGRFCWCQFQPISRPDPYLPMPTVDFGKSFFEKYGLWGRHYTGFSYSDIEDWSREAVSILDTLQEQLQDEILTADERAWLMSMLWQVYAQPRRQPDVVTIALEAIEAKKERQEAQVRGLELARLQAAWEDQERQRKTELEDERQAQAEQERKAVAERERQAPLNAEIERRRRWKEAADPWPIW